MAKRRKRTPIQEPKRLNVSLGRKFNVGNYETVDLHFSLSRDMEPTETYESAFTSIFEEVRAELNTKAAKMGISKQT